MKLIIRHSFVVLFMALVTVIFTVGCANDRDLTTRSTGSKEGVMSGTLVGVVTLGPMLPVERNDTPSHSGFASGIKLVISNLDGLEIKSVVTDSNGRYSTPLPPGRYHIDMPSSPMGFTKDLPATITIIENKETHLDIRIDTGIR